MTVHLSLPLATRFVSVGVKQVIRYRFSSLVRRCVRWVTYPRASVMGSSTDGSACCSFNY